MQLNIKNPDVTSAAAELARLTGETVTKAVGIAVQERLERVLRADTLEAKLELLHAIQARVAESYRAEGRHPPTQQEINDDLYDKNGLPH